METARSQLVRNTVALFVAFALGVLISNPAGFMWRVRFWIPAGNRAPALAKLVDAEPGGANTELDHALDSDDADLSLAAAVLFAQRGDRRGIETLVKLCDAKHPGAREALCEMLIEPGSLDNYETAQEWYASSRHAIHFEPTVRWSGVSVN